MELEQLQKALASVEAATAANPSSYRMVEATLTEFRASPAALQISRYILEHSGQDAARFQAALALREAALQQWPLLPMSARTELRSWLLHYLLRRAGEMALSVRQLIAVLAVVVKRDWIDQPDQRQVFFQEAEAASSNRPQALQLQMAVFEAIVVEFVPATATAMHLPWDFHGKCSADFQAHYLLPLFVLGINVARQHSVAGSSCEDLAAASAAMRLLSAILEWDFRASAVGVSYATWEANTEEADQVLRVRLPVEWRDTLLAPQAVTWLTDLLHQLPSDGGTASQKDLATAARRLVVCLCGVSGDIFMPPSCHHEEDEHDSKARFLAPLLGVALQWTAAAEGPPGIERNEALLMDGCMAIAAAAPTHRAAGFQAACPPGGTVPAGAISALTCITICLIKAGGVSDDLRGEPIGDATELLLEAWRDLVTSEHIVDHYTSAAAAEVFSTICSESLQEMAIGASQDAEDEVTEQGLEVYRVAALERACGLGRVAPTTSLPLITHHLNYLNSTLQGTRPVGGELDVILEKLWWLLSAAAALVADAAVGETPSPPQGIAAAAAAAGRMGVADPLANLSQALLAVCGLLVEPSVGPLISPRLVEAALAAAARWARVYLLPETAISPEMHRLYGEASGGTAATDFLVQAAVAGLKESLWAPAVQRAAIATLLSALATLRPALTTALLLSPAWHSLLRAIAEYSSEMRGLDVALQGELMTVALSAAVALPESGAADRYARTLLHTVVAQLASVAGAVLFESLVSLNPWCCLFPKSWQLAM